MKCLYAIICAMFLLASCSSNSQSSGDESSYPSVSVQGGKSIEGTESGISSLPTLEFGGLSYFNSSKIEKEKADRPEGVKAVVAVRMEGNKITLNTETDTMIYRISFPDSYETIGEDSYGWRFSVTRLDTSFVDISEVCLYEEDKDGLPYFAFINRNGQWSTWDILSWNALPKRKIMAKHPTDEEVASYQERKLGEDFVGL